MALVPSQPLYVLRPASRPRNSEKIGRGGAEGSVHGAGKIHGQVGSGVEYVGRDVEIIMPRRSQDIVH